MSHQSENDRARYRYIYEETEVLEDLTGSGTTEKPASKTYTWIHTELQSFSKLISVNGARYDRRYLEAQDEAINRSMAVAERLAPKNRRLRLAKTQKEREEEMQAELFRNLLAAFRFSHRGGEIVNGLETFILEFKPKAGFKPPSARSAFLLSLNGKLWITRESHQLIRLTGILSQDVNSVGGIFGSLKKGATLTLEQADIGNGLWLPTFTTVTYRHNLLFRGTHRRQTSLYRNYRLNPIYRRTRLVQVERLD